jgi:hypothetical protein
MTLDHVAAFQRVVNVYVLYEREINWFISTCKEGLFTIELFFAALVYRAW